jgi:AcrR family transcriptional regulator
MSGTRSKSTKSNSATPGAVKLGRPRVAESGSSGENPREEILQAAATLFTAAGYRQTGTKDIADAVGLRQSSLFYYFPKKEDILTELLDRIVRTQLEFADRLALVEAPPAERLYVLVYGDVSTLAAPPGNLGWLFFQPEVRAGTVADFSLKHVRLRDAYRSLLDAGMKDGSFVEGDLELTTNLVCGLVDGVTTWYEAAASISDDEHIWSAVSDHALRGLLTKPAQLKRIRAGAERIRSELSL